MLGRRVSGGARGTEDAELILAAQRGSAEAIDALVRKHWQRAYAVSLGIVGDSASAEDATQEAMLAAIRGLGSFDRRRPFAPWLNRIVANRSIDSLRARSRRREAPLAAELVDQAQSGERLNGDLGSALESLGPRDRAIVVLRHVGEFTSEEVGSMLEIPPSTVRSHLKRALDRVRHDLQTARGGE